MSLLKRMLAAALRTDLEGRRVSESFNRLLRQAPASSTLLDVGCGDGTEALLYRETLSVPQGEVWGIEAQEKYVKSAKKKIKVQVKNLESERFSFKDEAFDVVTCNQILEHLKNIFLPLSEMERVLKTGGHLAIGIPNLAALHNRFLLMLGYQPVCNHICGPHIRCYTHKAFTEFIKSNPNFELESVTGASLYPLPYPAVKFGAWIMPSLAAYTFYLLRKKAHDPEASTWRITTIGDTCL
ncbi:MAG: class I SAM-dependent methyltransferase [Elusimicrobiota bacterium]